MGQVAHMRGSRSRSGALGVPAERPAGGRGEAPREVKIMRDIILLACTDCKRRNYSTTKNKRKATGRLEFKKYCRFCRSHTVHRESK